MVSRTMKTVCHGTQIDARQLRHKNQQDGLVEGRAVHVQGSPQGQGQAGDPLADPEGLQGALGDRVGGVAGGGGQGGQQGLAAGRYEGPGGATGAGAIKGGHDHQAPCRTAARTHRPDEGRGAGRPRPSPWWRGWRRPARKCRGAPGPAPRSGSASAGRPGPGPRRPGWPCGAWRCVGRRRRPARRRRRCAGRCPAAREAKRLLGMKLSISRSRLKLGRGRGSRRQVQQARGHVTGKDQAEQDPDEGGHGGGGEVVKEGAAANAPEIVPAGQGGVDGDQNQGQDQELEDGDEDLPEPGDVGAPGREDRGPGRCPAEAHRGWSRGSAGAWQVLGAGDIKPGRGPNGAVAARPRGQRGAEPELPAKAPPVALHLVLIAVIGLVAVPVDVALVALAGDQGHPGLIRRSAGQQVEEAGDGRGALHHHLRGRARMPVRMSAMMRSGSSVRGLSEVTMIRSDWRATAAPIRGRLPWSRSPPQPNRVATLAPGNPARMAVEDGLQGVRGMGEVDDDGPVADGPALEAAIDRGQIPPVLPRPRAQDAVRQGLGQGVVGPVVLQGQEGLGGDGLRRRVAGPKTSMGTRGSPRPAGAWPPRGCCRRAARPAWIRSRMRALAAK